MRGRWSARAFALCSLWLGTSALRAEVTLDNFTAAVPADDQPVALDITGAPTYLIDESMGLRPSADPNDPNALGPNLFHSFLRFEIGQGETALFSQNIIDGSDPIANVIARVSGGLPSTIDGTLRSAIAGAAFWLVNPAGVLFGAGAQIDVGGTFNVGAADFIVFGDGTQLPVFNDAAVLSIANPVEFGFLETGGGVGKLTVRGVSLGGAAAPDPADTFDGLRLAGREIAVEATGALETDADGTATGNIDLVARDRVTIGGLVTTTTSGESAAGEINVRGGHVSLEPQSRVSSLTAGAGNAGSLTLRGDSVTLNETNIAANTDGTGDAGDIDIFGTEFVKTNQVIRNELGEREGAIRTEIGSESLDLDRQSGAPGDIRIGSNGAIELINTRASILNRSSLPSVSDAASISLEAPTITLTESRLRSVTQGTHDAGDVNVLGQDVFFDSAAIVVFTNNLGNAGSVNIVGTDTVVATNDPGAPNSANKSNLISSDSRDQGDALEVGSAAAGSVSIRSDGVIDLTATEVLAFTDTNRVVTDEQGNELRGNLTIDGAQKVILRDSAVIADALSDAAAGDITISGGEILIDGAREVVTQTATPRSLGRGIGTSANGAGDAGSITIRGDSVTLHETNIAANTDGIGDAGDIDIFGADFVKTNQVIRNELGERVGGIRTEIGSESLDLDRQSGAPGDIRIGSNGTIEFVNARASILNRSSLPSVSDAASISLEAPAIALTESRLRSVTQGTHDAGDINVLAQDVLLDSATIVAFTNNLGNAGSINIVGTDSVVATNDPGAPNSANKSNLISSDSRDPGDSSKKGSAAAGSVSIRSEGVIDLTATEVLAFTDTNRVVIDEQGNELRGNLTIDGTQKVILRDSAVIADALSDAAAGDITITGGEIVIDGAREVTSPTANPRSLGRGVVTSARGAGDAGSITIHGESVTLKETNVAAPTSGAGDAGSIDIFGATFVKTNEEARDAAGVRNSDRRVTEIASETEGNRTGAPGDIRIRSNELVDLVNTRVSVFNTDTVTADQDLPSIHIESPDGTISLVEANLLSATQGIDDAGNVNVLARDVFIDSSNIQAFTRNAGNAGSLNITGTRSVVTTNDADAPNAAEKFALISSDSRNPAGSGAAGSVTIRSDGKVDLTATEVLAFTDSSRVVKDDQGKELRGSISIQGGSVALNRAAVIADSSSNAAAGDVSITGGEIIINGARNVIAPTANRRPLGRGVIASAGGAGDAGSITIRGDSVTLHETNVAANTNGTGDAGDIDIFGTDFVKTNQVVRNALGEREGGIRTEIGSESLDGQRRSGAPGDIRIGSNGTIEFVNARASILNRSSLPRVSDIASISLEAPTVALVESRLRSITQGTHDAGDINVLGQDVLLDSATIVAFTNNLGNAGSINVVGTDSVVATNDPGAPNSANKSNLISSDSRDRGDSSKKGSAAAGSVSIRSDGVIDLTATEVLAFTDTNRVVTDGQGNELRGNLTIDGAQKVVLRDSAVIADALSDAAAGDITISGGEIVIDGAREVVTETATPRTLGRGIVASANGAGDAGSITIRGQSVTLKETNVAARTAGRGDAGSIDIFGADFVKTNEEARDAAGVRNNDRLITEIASETDGNRTGAPGDIRIRSNELVDLVNTRVSVFNTDRFTIGNGTPSIHIESPDGTISLVEANLLSATQGIDDAGNVNVLARDVFIDSSNIQAFTRNAGNAGSLNITGTRSVVTTNDADAPNAAEKFVLIASDSRNPAGSGAAGSVTIRSDGNVDLTATEVLAFTDTPRVVTDEQGKELRGSISIFGGDGVVLNQSAVIADSSSNAAAGDVNISGGEIVVNGARNVIAPTANERPLGSGVIASASGAGNAGSITINSPSVTLQGGGRFESSTTSTGAGGSVRVDANDLTIAGNGSGLFSESNGAGPGGLIQIGSEQTPVQRMSLSDLASISSNASAEGDGGSTTIFAVDLDISNGARVESRAAGTGDSGSIALSVQRDLRVSTPVGAATQSGVFTDSVRSTGGSIAISVGDEFAMANSRIASSVQEDDGKGGDVAIQTRSLLMQSSQILAQADAGNGGQISINRVRVSDDGAPDPTLGFFLIDTQSVINADSASGINGEISIDAPDVDVSSAILPQDARIVHTDELAPDFCAGTNKLASSFMVVDRGGMTPAPDEYLSAGFDPIAEGNAWITQSPAIHVPPVTSVAQVGPCN